jgi:predicted membrane-bound mannosyltransferase
LTALALAAGTCHLGWQSYRASYVEPTDQGNPYVYAHTLPDAVRLSADLQQIAEAMPEGEALVIKVIWHDGYYWPLPWYLRRFEQVELWTRLPDDPVAPLVIASPQHDAALTEKLDATHWMTGYYGLRPNVMAQLWVEEELWKAHLRRLGRL